MRKKLGKMPVIRERVELPKYERTMDDYGVTEEDQEKLRDIAFKIGMTLGIYHEAVLERLLLCIISMDKREDGKKK